MWFSAWREIWSRIGGEAAVLVCLILVVIGSWGFLALADEVEEGDLQTIDERILLSLRRADDLSKPAGPDWMGSIARDITSLGGYAVLSLVLLAVSGYLFLDNNYRVMWFVLTATVGGYALSMGLKSIFDRARPEIVPHLTQFQSSSFPSGHSMMSAVMYLTLGTLLARLVAPRRLKVYFLSVATVLAVLVGLSRVYLGVHYLTDVMAGWSAGVAWSVSCWLVIVWLQRRGNIAETNGVTNEPAKDLPTTG